MDAPFGTAEQTSVESARRTDTAVLGFYAMIGREFTIKMDDEVQKMALVNSRILRCISGSSVMGRAIATSQARSAGTPCWINVPA